MPDKIIKRDGRVVPFDRRKITMAILQAAVAVGGRDKATAEKITDDVIRHLELSPPKGTHPAVEEIQDYVERALIKHGHAKTAKAYILYRYEHSLKRAGKESLTYSSENIPYKKLWQALSWCVDHKCVSLDQVNRFIKKGRFKDLIALSDEFYTKEIEAAFEKLAGHLDTVKVIIVTGPSSSGKTTSTIKLKKLLEARGYNLLTMNVDNYFYGLEYHPQDSKGDYDFETPQALDLVLLRKHLSRLLDGKAVEMPYYNFKKSRRDGRLPSARLKDKGLVLIDSLHGMHADMTGHIPAPQKFAVYIETLSQQKDEHGRYIRWADIRMARRMVRDRQFRNYAPEQTITHWHYVRRAELRYIVPQLNRAQAIINSYLPYELPVLKAFIGKTLPALINKFNKEPEAEDALYRTQRLKAIFDEFSPWSDESLIPSGSLLREFIGGSRYEY